MAILNQNSHFFRPPPAAIQLEGGTVVNKLLVWVGALFWTSGGWGWVVPPPLPTYARRVNCYLVHLYLFWSYRHIKYFYEEKSTPFINIILIPAPACLHYELPRGPLLALLPVPLPLPSLLAAVLQVSVEVILSAPGIVEVLGWWGRRRGRGRGPAAEEEVAQVSKVLCNCGRWSLCNVFAIGHFISRARIRVFFVGCQIWLFPPRFVLPRNNIVFLPQNIRGGKGAPEGFVLFQQLFPYLPRLPSAAGGVAKTIVENTCFPRPIVPKR